MLSCPALEILNNFIRNKERKSDTARLVSRRYRITTKRLSRKIVTPTSKLPDNRSRRKWMGHGKHMNWTTVQRDYINFAEFVLPFGKAKLLYKSFQTKLTMKDCLSRLNWHMGFQFWCLTQPLTRLLRYIYIRLPIKPGKPDYRGFSSYNFYG